MVKRDENEVIDDNWFVFVIPGYLPPGATGTKYLCDDVDRDDMFFHMISLSRNRKLSKFYP